MPDITMCLGVEVKNVEDPSPRFCPMRETCYRCAATPTPRRQAYFSTLPLTSDDTCEHYWPVEAEMPGPSAIRSALRKPVVGGGES